MHVPTHPSNALADACRREVEGLHRFFEGWFRGDAPAAQIERLERALAPTFFAIFPSGTRLCRDEVVAVIRGNHGSRASLGPAFRIAIEGFEVRHLGDQAVLCVYQEWQEFGREVTGRVSTVLFGRDGTAPEGVRWLHLHETWLPGHGETS